MDEDEQLELPVTYKGEELSFPLKVSVQGYVYRFVVQIGEAEVAFEKDDAGEIRATISKPDEFKGKPPEYELLAAISDVLETLFA